MKTSRPGNRTRRRLGPGPDSAAGGHVPAVRVICGFAVPLDLRLRLEARADAEGASMSMVAVAALREYLEDE